MADRIQKQKPEESNSDRILREMDEQLAQGPVTFEGQTGRQSLSQASSQANSTIGNIDSALAENDAANAREGAGVQSPGALTNRENVDAPWTTRMEDDSKSGARERLQSAASGLKSKKGLAAGLGVGGGVVGIAIFVALLLPLKIIGLMDSVVNKMGAEVEHVVEKRAERVFARAILGNGSVTIVGGPFKSLVATIRTNRFESKLFEEKGLKIVDNGDKGVKLLVRDGAKLDSLGTFKDAESIQKALDANKLTNGMLKDIVKEQIPTWRWLKRAKFVKFLRIKYHVSRFGVIEKDDPKKTPQENADATRAASAAEDIGDTVAVAEEVLNCALEGACPTDLTDEAKPLQEGAPDSGSDTSSSFEGTSKEVAAQVQSEVDKSGLKGLNKFISKQLGKIIGDKLAVKLVKGGNAALLIDTVAWLDHVLYSGAQNHIFEKLPQYYKKLVLAKMFAEWAGNMDQIKTGQMSPELVQDLAGQLSSDSGDASNSQTFNYINGHPQEGVPVESDAKINETGSDTNVGDEILNGYKTFSDDTGLHTIANIWYKYISPSIGEILGVAWSAAKTTIETLVTAATCVGTLGFGCVDLNIDSLLAKATSFIKGYFLSLFGFDSVSPLDRDEKLYNDLGEGGTVAFNDYCHGVGCRKLNDAQAADQQNIILAEQQQEDQSKGLAYQLFDTNNTRSFISQLAISLPTGSSTSQFATTLASGLGIVNEIPRNLSSLISSQAYAADTQDYSYKDLYGVQPYGALESDLNQPVSDAAIADQCDNSDGTPIVPHDGSGFDECTIDNEIADSMTCAVDTTQGDCSGGQPTDSYSGTSYNYSAQPSDVADSQAVQSLASIFRTINVVVNSEATSAKQVLNQVGTLMLPSNNISFDTRQSLGATKAQARTALL